jgi:hypothetical protein
MELVAEKSVRTSETFLKVPCAILWALHHLRIVFSAGQEIWDVGKPMMQDPHVGSGDDGKPQPNLHQVLVS